MLRICVFNLSLMALSCVQEPRLLTDERSTADEGEKDVLQSRCENVFFFAEETEEPHICSSPAEPPGSGGDWLTLDVRRVRVVAPVDPRGAFAAPGDEIIVTRFGYSTFEAVDADHPLVPAEVHIGDVLMWNRLHKLVNDIGYDCDLDISNLVYGDSFRFRSTASHDQPLPEDCGPEAPDEPGQPAEVWPRPVDELLLSKVGASQ